MSLTKLSLALVAMSLASSAALADNVSLPRIQGQLFVDQSLPARELAVQITYRAWSEPGMSGGTIYGAACTDRVLAKTVAPAAANGSFIIPERTLVSKSCINVDVIDTKTKKRTHQPLKMNAASGDFTLVVENRPADIKEYTTFFEQLQLLSAGKPGFNVRLPVGFNFGTYAKAIVDKTRYANDSRIHWQLNAESASFSFLITSNASSFDWGSYIAVGNSPKGSISELVASQDNQATWTGSSASFVTKEAIVLLLPLKLIRSLKFKASLGMSLDLYNGDTRYGHAFTNKTAEYYSTEIESSGSNHTFRTYDIELLKPEVVLKNMYISGL